MDVAETCDREDVINILRKEDNEVAKALAKLRRRKVKRTFLTDVSEEAVKAGRHIMKLRSNRAADLRSAEVAFNNYPDETHENELMRRREKWAKKDRDAVETLIIETLGLRMEILKAAKEA